VASHYQVTALYCDPEITSSKQVKSEIFRQSKNTNIH